MWAVPVVMSISPTAWLNPSLCGGIWEKIRYVKFNFVTLTILYSRISPKYAFFSHQYLFIFNNLNPTIKDNVTTMSSMLLVNCMYITKVRNVNVKYSGKPLICDRTVNL